MTSAIVAFSSFRSRCIQHSRDAHCSHPSAFAQSLLLSLLHHSMSIAHGMRCMRLNTCYSPDKILLTDLVHSRTFARHARFEQHRQLSHTRWRYARLSASNNTSIISHSCSQRRSATSVGKAVQVKDEYNPPRTTLPPELVHVERGSDNIFSYLWKLAKTYGAFYKAGGKAIFTNRNLAVSSGQSLKTQLGTQIGFDPFDRQLQAAAIKAGIITRSDFQLLRRNAYDIARLPIFGVLILIMGEWLPLIVPFMPYAVPLTCRIPSQVKGMRTKVQERRQMVFRQGIEMAGEEQMQTAKKSERQGGIKGMEWLLLDESQSRDALQSLRSEQLWYLSCVLNLHGKFWETLQQRPPAWLLQRRLARRLHYLAQDDLLLTKAGDRAATALEEEELMIACEERGLDVLGPSTKQLEVQLASWLKRQHEDKGTGIAMLHMLFRR